MKRDALLPAGAPATLQDVLDRLAAAPVCPTRANAICVLPSSPSPSSGASGRQSIPLDLADIRATLDGMVPAAAQVSRKRWANLRSDLAAAIEASGLRPMLKTAGVALDERWSKLLQPIADQVSAMACRALPAGRACARSIREDVDAAAIERFIAELAAATLIRNLDSQRRSVATAWNTLVRLRPDAEPADRRGAGAGGRRRG